MSATCVSGSLEVDGCFNVRDAGGWSVSDGRRMRSGILFRADEPNRLTPRGRAVMDAIGLQAVIDLRSQQHFDRAPGFGPADVTYNLPVVDRVISSGVRQIDGPADVAMLYDEMVQQHRGMVVRAVELIAAHGARGPVLVHCMAGKDRTGIVVALVQAAVGVPLESIVEDYARSDGPTRQRRTAMIANPLPGDPAVVSAPDVIWTAPPEAMQLFAGWALERHGSLEAWPLALGVSPASIAGLRDSLLAD